MKTPGRGKLLLLILLLPALIGAAVGASQTQQKVPPAKQLPVGFEQIYEVTGIIEKQYVAEPDREKMLRDALSGMVGGLDPYSAYLTPELLEEEEDWIDGSFTGIGIEVSQEGGGLTIVTPIEGGPAKRAGILSGDVIEEINSDPVVEMSYEEALTKLRGPEDTRIDLGIRRGDEEKLRNYKLTREKIVIKSVYAGEAGGVEVIRLTSFQRSTVEEFEKVIAALRGKEVKGVVLDLRDNPGGLIDQAVKAADMLLASGTIVSTKGRVERENALYVARDGGSEPRWPLAVLINQGSASAAEILAGAFRDRGRALIVGEKSYGKGSVQSIIELSGGNALRLTTALYYTPSGVSIHKNGITPDVVVEWERDGETPAEPTDASSGAPPFTGYDLEKDPQLKAAVSLVLENKCPAFESPWKK